MTTMNNQEKLEYLAGQVHLLTVALVLICESMPVGQRSVVLDGLQGQLSPNGLSLSIESSQAAIDGYIERLQMIVEALQVG